MKTIIEYANAFVTALLAGEIEKPASTDCFYCSFGDDFSTDHLRGHIDEGYFVPSLLLNAVKLHPVSIIANAVIGVKLGYADPQDVDCFADIVKTQIVNSLCAYLNARLLAKTTYNAIEGIDSFDVCANEGYTMVRYNKDVPLDKQTFEFVRIAPDYLRDEMRKEGIRNKKITGHHTASGLLELYQANKEDYDDFADNLASFLKFDHVCDYLALADSMDSYNGVIFN